MTNEDSGWMRNPPIKQKKEIEKNNNKKQKVSTENQTQNTKQDSRDHYLNQNVNPTNIIKDNGKCYLLKPTEEYREESDECNHRFHTFVLYTEEVYSIYGYPLKYQLKAFFNLYYTFIIPSFANYYANSVKL